jgi:hypothetical protein
MVPAAAWLAIFAILDHKKTNFLPLLTFIHLYWGRAEWSDGLMGCGGGVDPLINANWREFQPIAVR